MKDGGGSAFPSHEIEMRWSDNAAAEVPRIYTDGGMSMRDYFAAAAMQGMLARNNLQYLPENEHIPQEDAIAETAYNVADAMLKERAK